MTARARFHPDLPAFWCPLSQRVENLRLGTPSNDLRGRMSLTPLSPSSRVGVALLGAHPCQSFPLWLNDPLWSPSFLEAKAFLIK